LQGAGLEQLLARYEIQLAEVKQAKTANNIFILLVATVPPVLIYLIILWIVAGFWQQSKGNS
jgi:pilus assembly protein TadC